MAHPRDKDKVSAYLYKGDRDRLKEYCKDNETKISDFIKNIVRSKLILWDKKKVVDND